MHDDVAGRFFGVGCGACAMTPSGARSRGRSEPASATALLATTIACAGVLFAQPRAVAPVEAPPLVLPAGDVRDVIAADRALATRTPPPGIDAIEALFVEQGVAETKVLEEFEPYQRRGEALRAACAALAAQGADAGTALRARAAERLDAALGLRVADADIPGVIGSFARTLEREGVTRDAEIVAPGFVVRTLYKARTNLLCGFPPDTGFARVERLAYYGWQSLHATRLPPVQRLGALDRYAAAGGTNVDEARGVLAFVAGEYADAERALLAAYRRTGSLRIRNHLLAARALRAAPER